VALWEALLGAGARPCGLAARDSLRTEAGLPLYGHELAGPLGLAPFHIGFDNFVKQQKPAEFIGKGAYAARAAAAKSRLVRFRMSEKGVRPSKLGDPVLDRRGRVVGTVTSCAQDTEGFLTGMALIEGANPPAEGASFGIVALPERLPEPLKPFAPFGARALVPDGMMVVGRWKKE
jgi:glycine hydroxymethyltransferase